MFDDLFDFPKKCEKNCEECRGGNDAIPIRKNLEPIEENNDDYEEDSLCMFMRMLFNPVKYLTVQNHVLSYKKLLDFFY
jgi:hypothetical protein